jgi:DNA repair exonuclease SbcCD ATPase subunit|nr:MAG TPA: minor tail protein [Caudoviricetes sp.]
MATDIGARIGIDGEKSFRDSLSAVNAQLKNLGSEMKAVVSSFTGMEDSEESLTAQGKVLERSIQASADKISLLTGQSERAKAKLDELARELDDATRSFGANSTEAIRAQNAYNKQVRVVNNLESQINSATADMNKMKRQMDRLGKSADELSDDLQDAGREAKSAGSSFKDAFAGGVIAGAVQSLVSGIVSLVESTKEYSKIMGTLEVSSQKAGYSAEQTQQTYTQLYGVLGDNQSAATAAANLQALKLSQEQLTQLTDGAIGAWATYGDSIPIDSLAEAINETVKVGQVTGTFADVLNWAGTSEDDFNKKLEATKSESERANLVLQELSKQGLTQAAEAWRENNAELEAANRASAAWEQTTGRLGTALMPLTTSVTNLGNALLTNLLNVMDGFQNGGVEGGFSVITDLINGLQTKLKESLPLMIESGLQSLVGFTEGLRSGVGTLVDAGLSLLQTLADGIIQNLPTLIETIPQIVINIAGIINDNAPKLIVAALTLIKNLAIGLVKAIPTLVANIPKIIQAIVSAFLAFNWLSLGKNLMTALKDGIKSMGPAIKTTAGNIFNSIKTTLSNIPAALKTIGSNGISSLAAGLKSMAKTAVGVVREVGTNILNAIKALPGKMVEIGKNILDGLKEGILSKVKEIGTAASEVVDTVKNIFTGKSGFDTHSPSKWSEDVGENVDIGLANGLKGKADVPISAMEDLTDGVLHAASEMDGAVTVAKKTARKVGDVLQAEINQINQKIEAEQKKASEEAAAEELKQYQDNLSKKYQELSKAEGENAQKIREEIAELEAEWNKKQVEAARTTAQAANEARLQELQTFQQEYESALDAIESKQESLQDQLADYGELFQRIDIKDEEGNVIGEKFQLGDLQKEIDQIQKYGDALEKLQERGLSDGLLSEITNMGMEDAMDYMNKLISISDGAFDDYVQLFAEKQKAAQEVAAKVYQSEFSSLEQNYFQKLPQSIADMQGQLFAAGTQAAGQFAAGMESQGTQMGTALEQAVGNAVSGSQETTAIQTFQSVTAGMTEQEPILTEYLTALKDRLIALVQGFQQEFQNVGLMLMEGVAKGVRDGQSGVVNAIAEVLAAAVRAARASMDINSPSGVYEEIGGYMAEGVGVGWNKKLKKLSGIIAGGMQQVVPSPTGVSGSVTQNNNSRSYAYGDINIYVDRIDNGNGRSVETFARELEFFRRQQSTRKGGKA